MLYVERSNRAENLLGGLAKRLMTPRPAPLLPSIVVVQGQGMERWIAQSIARDHGVCANTDFVFPRRLLERIFAVTEEAALGRVVQPNIGWKVEQLTWALARRIATQREAPELARLARHLGTEDGDWRLVQLAHQIAILFDDYITYRPDWVLRWARDPAGEAVAPGDADERWQSWLFRGLHEDLGPGHLADRADRFLQLVRSDEPTGLAEALSARFPAAIEIFAVSTLPPLYLGVLDGLAQLVDIHLSVLCPSRHYWADLWSEVRDEARAAPAAGEEGLARVRPTSSASSLLAGLGRLGSDFQRGLEQVSGYIESEADLFEDPCAPPDSSASLLARLQSRLLDLDAADESENCSRVARGDRSLQVHLCHGPKRELEVVHAAIREAFEADPSLTPEDVIVMAPEIDALVPTIDAVFGGADDEEPSIPYGIADRGRLRRSQVAASFLSLLDLLEGRGGRSEVLDWLAREPARGRLGLDAESVEALGEWAARAGIRFGFDADHREALGLEALDAHTWSGGLDRLVLGHAVGASAEIFAGLSPEPLDPLSDASLLGAIGELEAILSRARHDLARPRTVEEWSRWLLTLLEQTVERRSDNAHEHGTLRQTLQDLATAAEQVRFEHSIPFQAMRERFHQSLTSSPPVQGFLSGGVTFCELVPLRAIPFRVIAILGLSDTRFPRRRPAPSHDLMARDPRAGDRNSGSDDRYLFLEALISARDRLILTLPVRDLRDGSDLPPSVVVSELLDALDLCFEPEDAGPGERLRDMIVVEHPLQSFSPRYFEPDAAAGLVGLDSEAFEGARALREALEDGGGVSRRFLEVLEPPPITAIEAAVPRLELDEFGERLLRSTRRFARDRLGLRLPRPERAVADFDPDRIDALDAYALGSALLADLRSGADRTAIAQYLAAHARLPTGEPGRIDARALLDEVISIAEIGAARIGTDALVDHAFDLTLEGVGSLGTARLGGLLRDVGPSGLVRLDFARIGRRSELMLWLEHLVLCALVEQGAEFEPQSLLVARAEKRAKKQQVVCFEQVPDAHRELAQLFEWAWSVDRAPLPFFAKSSRSFAARWKPEDPEPARREAFREFYGNDSSFDRFVESEEDLETALVWEGVEPLDSAGEVPVVYRFELLAQRFFEPFEKARKVTER